MLLSNGFADLDSLTARRLSSDVLVLWARMLMGKEFFLQCDWRPLRAAVVQWCCMMPEVMAAQSEYNEQEKQLNLYRKELPVSLVIY
jgi:hypothetical protein